ncbi:universal stress protein [Psychrobacter phenylpyruvicus]|uniref:Universal stress protein family n=1 Tax=Psychrobacter phenylpyruvicus TaxID=29432 RepID=A0A379LP35_9GAMM|nr:universal stress protein [Psychrobacter phenylpyruvicus]SUD91885.1 Universal stress protein family [Psychrobacter phenylpyruvicus]
MSNLRADSVIASLDCPNHVQAVLEASMWAAKNLQAPIGLLHAAPTVQHKEALDYSGCLVADDGTHLLNQLTLEEKDSNGKLRDQGRLLLKQAHSYCKQHQGRYQHQLYYLHRHASIAESLDYVDESAQLVVLGHHVTCKDTLSQLIRASRCPALVTHESFKIPKTALFGFDNRPTCHALLDWLCSTSLIRNLSLHVVMVGEDNERNKEALREAYARLTQSGIHCKKALIAGNDVTNALISYQHQNKLDLLITGAFGESRLHELLHGSNTRKLLKASQTPYLLYPKM